jgi:hypothetical protein
MRTVVVLGHEFMGHGDADLGRKILATFLRKSPAFNKLSAVVLFNAGVKLACAGSPVLVELQQLHDAGVDIKPCGTCIDFLGLREQVAVGQVSNMDEIIDELSKAAKVITL